LRIRALWLIGVVVTIACVGPASAAPAAGPSRGTATSAQGRSSSSALHFFHVRLSAARRADCVVQGVGSPRHPELRCDRFRLGPSGSQEISVHIVKGKASRLDPSDALPDPSGARLRAGRTLRIGPYACRATRHSIRCRDRHSGHGFRMRPYRLIVS
jgi:hypothetical protein